MQWSEGKVLAHGAAWDGALELSVDAAGETVRALAYTKLVGTPQVGDNVLLSSAAANRGLGTGGYHFVVAIPHQLPPADNAGAGHIVKARYTPLQYMTMGADEQESPWHDLLAEADSIDGMPVIVADLHSALPAVVAALRAETHEARIAYIMDDGGALPAWFSRTAATLKEAGHILGTISARQAFGGELETVNIHTALLAAKLVWKADIAIVTQGPGNLGTGTRWGFSGTSVGETVNAVNVLGGHAIGLLRMSNADARDRHYGLSHHSITSLTRVALSPVTCPVPELSDHESGIDANLRRRLVEQIDELRRCPLVTIQPIQTDGLMDILAASPVRLSTMGRGLNEDPLAFLAAGVAGRYGAEFLHS
ncbi:DUF3866 family protein [Arcanobacterium haemolyticum]|nr:DUF3866 family protein [Arcanobacterium haemolyticum]